MAHARSKLANFDGVCGPPGAVSAFLVAIAISANTMLKALYTRLDLAHLSAFLNNVEHKFSCQVSAAHVPLCSWRRVRGLTHRHKSLCCGHAAGVNAGWKLTTVCAAQEHVPHHFPFFPRRW